MEFTLSNVLGFGGLLGMIFTAYQFFKSPQDKLETSQLLAEKDIANKATILAQKEMESKADLLAKQVQWEKDANEKKFSEYGKKLDEVMLSSQKESIKIDAKLDGFIRIQTHRNEETSNNFTKLFTLLEERLPKNGTNGQ